MKDIEIYINLILFLKKCDLFHYYINHDCPKGIPLHFIINQDN